jgi:biopolymer transport protein ExbD
MNLTNHYPKTRARIDLLPLMDVIFLLLVLFMFLMLNMTLQHSIDIEVTLPTTVQANTVKQDTLQISIDQQGQLYLEHNPITLASLIGSVQQLQTIKPRPILIYGDERAGLGIAIKVLENLKTAGFTHVSFATNISKPVSSD